MDFFWGGGLGIELGPHACLANAHLLSYNPSPQNCIFVHIEYTIHMEIFRVNIDSIECLQLRPKRFMGGRIAQCLLCKPET